MFNPQSEVKAIQVRLKRQSREKVEIFNPTLSLLLWKEEGRYFVHCLELDIVGDGTTVPEAYKHIAELIVEQIEFAEENKTEILHPAPKEYWDKFLEIHLNQTKQSLLDDPPQSSKELVEGFQPVNA